MGAGGWLLMVGVLGTGWWLMNTKPDAARLRPPHLPAAGPMTGRELAGLVDVAYAEDLVLVSPRGVEFPYSPDWDLDDLLTTLAEVDAL